MNFTERLREIEEKFQEAKANRASLQKFLSEIEEDLKNKKSFLNNSIIAREIIRTVALKTQEQLEFRISGLVTLALDTMFPGYTFEMKFTDERRNKTECDLIFIKDGKNKIYDVLNEDGGGLADVGSFALRLAVWSIRKNRKLLILDEPFKFLSEDLQDKCSELVHQLSEELGIQIIMVSHLPQIISHADRIINIEQINGISKIRQEN